MKCTLPIGISAIACALAEKIDDDDELTMIALALDQLSDTLSILIAQRVITRRKTGGAAND